MNRQDVYKLIDGERDYQDKKWIRPESDVDHSIADWLIYMEEMLIRAKKELYFLKYDLALEFIRKLTALGVACMECNETKSR